MLDTLRPDPTFHPSPRLAMEAPRERIAYTALLSPDGSRPDALAVVDSAETRRIIGLLTEQYALRRYSDELDRRRRELSGE